MEDISVFTDKSSKPDEQSLAKAIGKSLAWWQEIREAERAAQFEIMCALREIEFRIRAVRRECAVAAPDLQAPAAAPWVPLCTALDEALAGTR